MALRPQLQINGLSKAFTVGGTHLDVLSDIQLSIGEGEFVSLVGPSGCGKSTLLRLLIGLDTQYDGDLQLDGQAVVGPGLERGIVFQEHRLLPWLSVADNIAFSLLNAPGTAAEKRKTVQEHIDLVGLRGFEKAYPSQISGGMSQRVAIARALVNRPKVLLLDEPFGALDVMTRAHLQHELQRIWRQQGVTMVMVTHDVEEAVFLSNRVIVMQPRPGRIAREVAIDLPFPRDRDSDDFHHKRVEIMRQLTH